MEVAVFIGQRCGCVFPASSMTTPQFTCPQQHPQYTTYRASVNTSSTVGVSREELVAALEEWPRTHRSILVQGERLSVEESCPIIITSLEEGECEVNMVTPPVTGVTTDTSTTPLAPDTVALSIFLIVVNLLIALLALAVSVIVLLFVYTLRSRRK